MIVKILLMACFLIVFNLSITFGFDDQKTHPKITEKVVSDISSLNAYLKMSLGFAKGIDSRFPSDSQDPNRSIIELLKQGSTDEDSPMCRASNHFHNPLNNIPWNESYMSDEPLWLDTWCSSWSPWYSNVTWATGYLSQPPLNPTSGTPDAPKAAFSTDSEKSPINWDTARDNYYKALTSTINLPPPFPGGRDAYFSKTFQALGHVLHLLQDVAVPAHVRNDFKSHLAFKGFKLTNPTKWFGNPFEYYVQSHDETITSVNSQNMKTPSFPNPRLTDFWDTEQYDGSNPSASDSLGLAEFVSANYLSDATIPYTIRSQKHVFPYPKIDDPNIQICKDYEPGKKILRTYLSRKDRGECPPITEARTADHFATLSLLNNISIKTLVHNVLTNNFISLLQLSPLALDDNVHKTYAKEILPRAVGYSAGLLNYFFRGTLEITAPDEYVYSIIDGSITPQQFTKIKAKVKNTTLNEVMTDGLIQAVAKYKAIPNYDPTLANYPPDGSVMKNIAYSYSVSTPMTLMSEQLASMNMYPTEFTFNFTGSPIPAGITDLYLQVIFKGTLGNEKDTAVAAGMKNLKEPTHHVFWNLTDMFSLDGHLYTAEQIRANPDLLQQAGDSYIDPHGMNFEVSYMPESPPATSPVVSATVTNLPQGRYIRLIALIDDELTENYARLAYTNNIDADHGTYDFLFEGAVNQETDGIWQPPTPVEDFRNAKSHYSLGVLRCKPIAYNPATGEYYCPYPESEAIPADPTPYPADIMFQ